MDVFVWLESSMEMEEVSFPLQRRKTVVNVESLQSTPKMLNPKGFFGGA